MVVSISVNELKNDPAFGSFVAIAAVCRGADGRPLSKQTVSKWKSIPAEHCRAIETATEGRFDRYRLRPDVFGDAPPGPAEAAA